MKNQAELSPKRIEGIRGGKVSYLLQTALFTLIALCVLGGTNDTLLAKYQVVVYSIYLVWNLSMLLYQKKSFGAFGTPFVLLASGLAIYLLAGTLFSLESALTLRFTVYYVVYLLLIVCYERQETYARFIDLIRIVAGILAVSIIVSAILGERFVSMFSAWLCNRDRVRLDIHYGQYSGLIGDRSFAALAMCTGVYAELATVFSNEKIKGRNALLIMIELVAMLLTGKRIVIAMLIVGMSVTLLTNRRFNKGILKAFALLGIFAALALLLIPKTSVFLKRILEGVGDGSFNNRTSFWKVAINMLEEKPIFGWGIGSYLSYNFSNGTGIHQYAHNMYFQFLGELGIVGFCAMLAFFVIPFKRTIHIVRAMNAGDRQAGKVLLFSLMAQTGFWIYGLTGYPFYNIQQGVLYAMSIAMIASVVEERTLSYGDRS